MRTLAWILVLVLSAASVRAQSERVPATATPPVHVGGSVQPPRRLKGVPPVYPPNALSAGVQGVVIVEATIGADGHVAAARVLRSIALLDAAALEAVSQWEFAPTTLNGEPVPIVMTVTVNFVLNDLVPRDCAEEQSMRSPEGTTTTTIHFLNQTQTPRKLYWLDAAGVRHWFQTLVPGEVAAQTTAVGHTWVVADDQDVCLAVYVANASPSRAVLRATRSGSGGTSLIPGR